jgi:hypothetical protein
MKPCNYELSDAENESCQTLPQNPDPQHNHIQIQMFYQPNSEIDSSVRQLIATMNETLERNNKAILTLIEVDVYLLRRVSSLRRTCSYLRRSSGTTKLDKQQNRAKCKRKRII